MIVKSDALLMAALMFVEFPSYSAIIFRRTFRELAMRGGLLQRSHEWLSGTAARFNSESHTWTFPSGATLAFGHMEHINDMYNYKSSEYAFCGFDELTSFVLNTNTDESFMAGPPGDNQYLYLFSRLRRNVDSIVPLRMRAASNPGDIGHEFVRQRFVEPKEQHADRKFIPSYLRDNPTLRQEEYTRALHHLDPLRRQQLLDGLWVNAAGMHFFPARWPRYRDEGDAYVLGEKPNHKRWLKRYLQHIIAVDWATSEKLTSDHTAMLVGGLTPDGEILLLDAVNARIRSEHGAARLNDLYKVWGGFIGSDDDILSKTMLLECRRWPLPDIWLMKIAGRSKIVRAKQAIIMGENGRIYLPRGLTMTPSGQLVDTRWLEKYCDQLTVFTGINKGEEDDLVDCTGNLVRMATDLKTPVHPSKIEEPCVLIPGKTNW